MHANQLFDEIKKQYDIESDTALAARLSISSARVSQLRASDTDLSPKQVVSLLKKATDHAVSKAMLAAIQPAVEMHPIDRTSSKQDAKWEVLPTDKDNNRRNAELRACLEDIQGIYIFFDSLGTAIYAGKTEKQNIWKEMTSAFNRERANHTAFLVTQPTAGEFKPAWQQPRQPKKRTVYLFDTAKYFSAYKVDKKLTGKLEAFVIRSFCNNLSNKKMEKF